MCKRWREGRGNGDWGLGTGDWGMGNGKEVLVINYVEVFISLLRKFLI
ncbi:hypothetical protein FDUTEX481_01456 [Tolypothrix sp. PCC 7601]|nr:hypothetical protein FDUTEX481_01456 [Tolypothrix sp. PCC 7601]